MDKHTKTQGVGNTKTTPLRARGWCFTLNNYTEDDIENVTHLAQDCLHYGVQEEVGASGTRHLQGFFYYKSARTFLAMKAKIDKAHWEKMRGNIKSNYEYCTAKKKRAPNGRMWTDKVSIRDPLDGLDLKDWQREILALVKTTPDDRTIHWYWDEIGCTGKTTIAKHICINDDTAIYVTGKSNDIKYAISQMKVKPRVVIWDLVRSSENFVSYEALEAVKNGIFFSGKYEGQMVIFDNPHVIVFANFEPDMDKLSRDRWKVTDISPDPTLIY